MKTVFGFVQWKSRASQCSHFIDVGDDVAQGNERLERQPVVRPVQIQYSGTYGIGFGSYRPRCSYRGDLLRF